MTVSLPVYQMVLNFKSGNILVCQVNAKTINDISMVIITDHPGDFFVKISNEDEITDLTTNVVYFVVLDS